MSRTVLLVGGLDSSGGAGLLRDVAAVEGAGIGVRVVATAVTAQTDRGVSAVHRVPTKVIRAQIAAGTTGPVGAIKTGMLCDRATVEAVAAVLPEAPLVVDPVIRSSSGRRLLSNDGLAAMIDRLLPRVTMLTPNLPELRHLGSRLGLAAHASDECRVEAILARGCGSVLVKGGHDGSPASSNDRLFLASGETVVFEAQRFPVSLRGTGCQLASAIAAGIATGATEVQAVTAAKTALDARFRNAADAPRAAG